MDGIEKNMIYRKLCKWMKRSKYSGGVEVCPLDMVGISDVQDMIRRALINIIVIILTYDLIYVLVTIFLNISNAFD